MGAQFDIRQYAHVADTMYIKLDEANLLLAIYEQNLSTTALDTFLTTYDLPSRRLCYILNKWATRGWLEYGVSPQCGWLTEQGKTAARALKTNGAL